MLPSGCTCPSDRARLRWGQRSTSAEGRPEPSRNSTTGASINVIGTGRRPRSADGQAGYHQRFGKATENLPSDVMMRPTLSGHQRVTNADNARLVDHDANAEEAGPLTVDGAQHIEIAVDAAGLRAGRHHTSVD